MHCCCRDREFQGLCGPGNKGPFLSPWKVWWSVCGSFGVRKANEGILQERKRFGEDLSGQGARRAYILLVCCQRMFSNFLRHLSLHWQNTEPGMLATWAPGPALQEAYGDAMWGRCTQNSPTPLPPSLLAVSRERQFPPVQARQMSRKSSFTVGIPPAATWVSKDQLQPLAQPLGLQGDSSGD